MIPRTFNVLFFLKKSKTDPKGLSHLYCRITINGDQTEISLGRKWNSTEWNQKLGRTIGLKKEAKELNHYIDTILFKIYEAKRNALEVGIEITPESIKEILTGKVRHEKMILEIFKEHNQKVKELVGKDYAPLTLVRFRTSLEHTERFIKMKYGKDDLEVSKIDYDFINSYEHYFKAIRNCNQNTSAKYISNFRKVVNHCFKMGWIKRDPFLGFKMQKIEVKRNILTIEEIETLLNKTFSIPRLEHVKDTFLFCCFTGLAYVDVQKLKPEDIKIGIDGEDWIFTARQKTDVDTRIPLLPTAKQIIEKYKNSPESKISGKILPVPSNQKMNAYLKEIADICGIEKTLTTHLARHTFATTVTLSNGVPIETVSKLLGHKNIRTTQHYAKILDLKVSNDMSNLRSKLLK
ncbi:MAG: site-specific integrase [Bacteroidota bacterium]